MPWFTEDWSRGILLGLEPDPNTGYRATLWFEYTRALFNAIREGSLVAVRNFNDRPDGQMGTSAQRTATYEEYSILQIDQVHPWHYAIQGSGDRGYPAFNVAAAESARRDWVEWDEQNRDDVTRIRCEAIPLRLAFNRPQEATALPTTFADRSKPMPGYEVRVLRPEMTEQIVNQGLVQERCIDIGRHVVQPEVVVRVSLPDLINLHFGIFGFTGAGKSNLLSTVNRLALSRPASDDGQRVFKTVLFDLMDEYTGLLIDQVIAHVNSRIVICGREAVDADLFSACIAASEDRRSNPSAAQPLAKPTVQKITQAAEMWAQRITLPAELRPNREHFWQPLARAIADGKVVFYEPQDTQGQNFNLDLGLSIDRLGAQTFGNKTDTETVKKEMKDELEPLKKQAETSQSDARDKLLNRMTDIVKQRMSQAQTDAGRKALEVIIKSIGSFVGSRGTIPRDVATWPGQLVDLLNSQPSAGQPYSPSLLVVIGENETAIASFASQLINKCFEDRRSRSLLYPSVSFIFDEADVFIAQQGGDGTVVDEATLLARRGRKFGLGLGIATQRIRYLNTSIMAQPHTYFISKLPRATDRQAIAEAFAISEESLEQSFGFTAGQWLIASHDATGLKGTPFPVQLPNANVAVRQWLEQYAEERSYK